MRPGTSPLPRRSLPFGRDRRTCSGVGPALHVLRTASGLGSFHEEERSSWTAYGSRADRPGRTDAGVRSRSRGSRFSRNARMPSRWSAVPNSSQEEPPLLARCPRDRATRRPQRWPPSRRRAPAAGPSANARATSTAVVQHLGRAGPRGRRCRARRASSAPHETARVHEVARTTRADQVRQPLRASRPRDHPERDLRLPDGRVVRQEPQVRRERELEPAAEREAVDRRDRDRGDFLEQVAGRARARRRSDAPRRDPTRPSP